MTTVSGSGSRYSPREMNRLASGGPSSQQSDRNNVPNTAMLGSVGDPVTEPSLDAARPGGDVLISGSAEPQDASARLAGLVSQILLEMKAGDSRSAVQSANTGRGRNAASTVASRSQEPMASASRFSSLETQPNAGNVMKQLLDAFSVESDDLQSGLSAEADNAGGAATSVAAANPDKGGQTEILALAIAQYKALSSDDEI